MQILDRAKGKLYFLPPPYVEKTFPRHWPPEAKGSGGDPSTLEDFLIKIMRF